MQENRAGKGLNIILSPSVSDFLSLQIWKYNNVSHQIVHSSKKCLSVDTEQSELLVETCDPLKDEQKWIFENLDNSKLET